MVFSKQSKYRRNRNEVLIQLTHHDVQPLTTVESVYDQMHLCSTPRTWYVQTQRHRVTETETDTETEREKERERQRQKQSMPFATGPIWLKITTGTGSNSSLSR